MSLSRRQFNISHFLFKPGRLFFVALITAVVTITLVTRLLNWPAENTLSKTIEVTVQYQGTSDDRQSALTFPGRLVEISGDLLFSVPATGESEKPARATGTVIIYNHAFYNQPLVATTRFLSSGGVLFRLPEAVVVPAGSEVTVTLVADQPGSSGDVPAGRFSIPGLSGGAQQQIYAESSSDFVGGSAKTRVVTADDLVLLSQKVEQETVSAVEELVMRELTVNEHFFPTLIDYVTDGQAVMTEPGVEATEAVWRQSIKARAVVYDQESLRQLVAPYFELPSDELTELKLEVLQNEWSRGLAKIKVTYEKSLLVEEQL